MALTSTYDSSMKLCRMDKYSMNRVLRVEVDDPIFGLNGSFNRVGWCNLYWSQDKAILLVTSTYIARPCEQYRFCRRAI